MPAVMDPAAVENARFNPTALDLDHIESRVENSLARRVGRLIDEFPDRALMVVRAWMAE